MRHEYPPDFHNDADDGAEAFFAGLLGLKSVSQKTRVKLSIWSSSPDGVRAWAASLRFGGLIHKPAGAQHHAGDEFTAGGKVLHLHPVALQHGANLALEIGVSLRRRPNDKEEVRHINRTHQPARHPAVDDLRLAFDP